MVDSDIFALAASLWRRKLLIVAISAAFVLAAVGYALLATSKYQADVVLAPRKGDALSGNLGQLGGLASLAGINLGGTSDSITPLAVLRSREFAREFIEKADIADLLLEDSDDAGRSLDIRDAVNVFDERVRAVTEDKRTGLVVLSITWKDPTMAAEWANALVVQANARLRNEALLEAERNVSFLSAQLSETPLPALQQSIGDVLKKELQKLVMARGMEEFAFKVVDKAVPPKRRVSPRRTLLVAFGAVIGFLSAVSIALLLNGLEHRRTIFRATGGG